VVAGQCKVSRVRPGRDVPYLHNAISRAGSRFTKGQRPSSAATIFNWLSHGTGCFFAAIVFRIPARAGPPAIDENLLANAGRMRLAILAISVSSRSGLCIRYSGLDAVLGLAFTRNWVVVSIFGTFLGWLGVV